MIRTVLLNLPHKIKGFIRKNEDDEYVCVLNSRYSWETNRETILHELKHIDNGDLYKELTVNETELKRHNNNI